MKLSIIVIEYQCMDDVLKCLASAEEHLGSIEHESVILSNSCYGQDQIHAYQERIGDRGRLVAASGNLGYAGGVNAALREVCGDYIYILNPDCLLTDGEVTSIIEQMDANPKWAMSGPRVTDEAGNVQPSCRRFPRPWTFFLVRTGLKRTPIGRNESNRYFMEDYRHDATLGVDWVSGGALLAKRSAVEAVGGMDERYFLYMEDVDLCRAFHKSGYIIKYCPISTVIHAGQHASIKGGFKVLCSRNFRWHISSLAKYFIKWNFRFR